MAYSLTQDVIRAHRIALTQVKNAYELSIPIAELVDEYCRLNCLDYKHLIRGDITQKLALRDDETSIVFLTTGKDSLFLLKKVLERGVRPVAVYISGINRSESIYEKRAFWDACRVFGVPGKMFHFTNSIKYNRSGHHIGLRDQVISSIAIENLSSKKMNLYFGVTHVIQPPKLYSETKEAHAYLIRQAEKIYDNKIEVTFLSDLGFHEFDALKWIVEENKLDLTTSCYAQMNFREQKNRSMRSNFPIQKLYKGCGHCIKCLRINGAILAFGCRTKEFEKYWMSKTENQPDDTIKKLRAHILEHK